jgi:hypothetical protein
VAQRNILRDWQGAQASNMSAWAPPPAAVRREVEKIPDRGQQIRDCSERSIDTSPGACFDRQIIPTIGLSGRGLSFVRSSGPSSNFAVLSLPCRAAVCGEGPPLAPADLPEQSRLRAGRRAVFRSLGAFNLQASRNHCAPFPPVNLFYSATSCCSVSPMAQVSDLRCNAPVR